MLRRRVPKRRCSEKTYPDLCSKAAALLQSVVKNHSLVDGNKHLGWLATAVFLELNDTRVVQAANDDVYGLVMSVAAGNETSQSLATRLEGIARSGDP